MSPSASRRSGPLRRGCGGALPSQIDAWEGALGGFRNGLTPKGEGERRVALGRATELPFYLVVYRSRTTPLPKVRVSVSRTCRGPLPGRKSGRPSPRTTG